jgi:hypothetical protein
MCKKKIMFMFYYLETSKRTQKTQKNTMNWHTVLTPRQLIIQGKKITADQALTILLRTDEALTNLPSDDCHPLLTSYANIAGLVNAATVKLIQQSYATIRGLRAIRNEWGYGLEMNGARGFVSPSGAVYFNGDIWVQQALQCVYDDCCTLATAFPFLHFVATLFDRSCLDDDGKPIIQIKIKEGKVYVLKTPTTFKQLRQERTVDEVKFSLQNPIVPCAYEEDFLWKAARSIRAIITEHCEMVGNGPHAQPSPQSSSTIFQLENAAE